jgi:hypothetical protein
MELTRDLKLVIPLDTEKSGRCYVYSLPIARVIYEQFVFELGEAYSRIFQGYDPKHVAMTAPQMAYPALKAVATRMGTWEGPAGVQAGLINELSRLTTVAHTTDAGWTQIPLQTALARGVLDEDEHAEVLSSLVFTLLAARVGPKSLMEHSLLAAGSPRDWAHTSSAFTAWLDSLPTLKPKRGTTKTPSSVPS